MSENMVGGATVKELFGVPVEGGEVFVYQVDTGSNEPYFNNFYIASFYNRDKSSEVVWGVGSTIVDTLKNAEINWDRYPCDEEECIHGNPFREAIEIISNITNADLTGEVTIKEVDAVDVGDGRVSVYEVKRDSNDLFFDDFLHRYIY